MIHWLQVAWNTYGIHPAKANGYQWFSGPEPVVESWITKAVLLAMYLRHHNCSAHGCPKVGRFTHPVHGNRVCKHHVRAPHVIHQDGHIYNKP